MTETQEVGLVEGSIDTVKRASIVPQVLEIICHVTGMGFAAVARVTPEQWIACEVLDNINFGLRVGGELKVDTTICHEIRQSGKEVVINHVAEDDFYCKHHTPLMYGFQSYISIPIKLADHSFFGTLCAIDPNPAILTNTPIRDLFKAYASLIAFLIDANNNLPEDKSAYIRDRSLAVLSAHLQNITLLQTQELSDENTTVRRLDARKLAAIHEGIVSVEELLAELKNI